MTAADLEARRAALALEVKQHKKAIQSHRGQLRVAAAELAELEASLRRLGLGFYTQAGAGAIHGRSEK